MYNENKAALFEAIFSQVSDAIYIIDPATSNIIDVNEAGCRDLRMTRDEVLEQSVLSLQRDVKGLPHWKDIVRAIRESGTFVFVGRHLRKDGSEFPVEVHTNYFVHAGSEYLVSIARDISERVYLREELQKRKYIHHFALEEAIDGLWDWDVSSGQVFFSPQWQRMMGFGPNEVEPVVETWKNMVHPDDVDQVMSVLGSHLAGRTVRYEHEYRLRNRNGEYIWVHDRGKVVERDARGEAVRVVGMVQDITERKLLEERLREVADRDELTGLLNRRAGYEYFGRYLSLTDRLGQHIGVVLFDVDYFKRINDELGHLTGDYILREIGQLLERSIRGSDILFRWGGEEFLLLLPDTDIDDAKYVADKLRRIVAEHVFEISGQQLHITVSAGVSVGPRNGSTTESLVGDADRALYLAKRNGRNCVASEFREDLDEVEKKGGETGRRS